MCSEGLNCITIKDVKIMEFKEVKPEAHTVAVLTPALPCTMVTMATITM